MILTGNEITKQVKKGKIQIENFDESRVTTNSYDVALGDELIIYTGKVIDPRKENPYKIVKIPKNGYKLNKGDFVVGHTAEKIGSTKFVPIIHGKSSIARLGLFAHITADLMDTGFYGNATLHLYATLPIKIYKGMLIGQISFWTTKGKISMYKKVGKNKKAPENSKA